MKCKCGKEMEKEITLSNFIYKCPCGEKIITDYSDREVNMATKLKVLNAFNKRRGYGHK